MIRLHQLKQTTMQKPPKPWKRRTCKLHCKLSIPISHVHVQYALEPEAAYALEPEAANLDLEMVHDSQAINEIRTGARDFLTRIPDDLSLSHAGGSVD